VTARAHAQTISLPAALQRLSMSRKGTARWRSDTASNLGGTWPWAFASSTCAFCSASSRAMASSSAWIAAGIASGRMMPFGAGSLPMISSTRRPLGSSMMRSPAALDLNL
jgi:hypothetical protein